MTGATTLSGAEDFSAIMSAADAAASSDALAKAVIDAISAPGYLTTGSSFTIDQSYSGDGLLVVTGSGDPITVSNDVTIGDGGRLWLLSGGALAIDAPITAEGAAAVSLAYDDSDPTESLLRADLDRLHRQLELHRYQRQSDHRQPRRQPDDQRHGYTLLYSLSDLAGINDRQRRCKAITRWRTISMPAATATGRRWAPTARAIPTTRTRASPACSPGWVTPSPT